jgi:hypothetical protein
MMPTPRHKLALLMAGTATVAIALVHVFAIFIGPDAFEYLDAALLAEKLREGWVLPVVLLTLAVVAVLSGFALYAFSAAGVVRPLPMLLPALAAIGGIFTVRGLGVVYFAYLVAVGSPDAIPREIGFSLVSLAVGVLFLWGRRGICAGS